MVEIINRIAIKSIVNVSFIVKEKSTKHISQSLCWGTKLHMYESIFNYDYIFQTIPFTAIILFYIDL